MTFVILTTTRSKKRLSNIKLLNLIILTIIIDSICYKIGDTNLAISSLTLIESERLLYFSKVNNFDF